MNFDIDCGDDRTREANLGKMKELQIETQNLARDWEGLVEDILSQPAVRAAVQKSATVAAA